MHWNKHIYPNIIEIVKSGWLDCLLAVKPISFNLKLRIHIIISIHLKICVDRVHMNVSEVHG